MNRAERRILAAMRRLGINRRKKLEAYRRLDDIVAELNRVVRRSPAMRQGNAAVTGAISEYLCRLALDGVLGVRGYAVLGREWQWLGDYSLPGNPLNVLLSIKSFKAKERLLVSGARALTSPTIGWGLFDDASEWSAVRTRSYVYAGFARVYMPEKTLVATGDAAKRVVNLNGNPLLRPLESFVIDLEAWVGSDGRIDIRRI